MIISIYDMDRTVTRRGTWVPWLGFWLRTQARWRVLLLPLLVPAGLAYALRLIDRGDLKALGQRILMGHDVARRRVRAAAVEFARQIVQDEVYPDAITAISAAKASGQTLVLATASNAYYVRAIAAQLGFDAVLATESRWAGDSLLPGLDGPNCYGAAKRMRVAAWLEAHAPADAEVRFYSDHLSDFPTFELVEARGGVAVAVNPSVALRAEARLRGWTIVDWGTTQGSFFERA